MTIRLIFIGLILGIVIGFIGFNRYNNYRTTFAVDDTTINGCLRLDPTVQWAVYQTTTKITSTTKNLTPSASINKLSIIITKLKKVEATFKLHKQTEYAIATKCIINNLFFAINTLRADIVLQKKNNTINQWVANTNQKDDKDSDISSKNTQTNTQTNTQIDDNKEKKLIFTWNDLKTWNQNKQIIETQIETQRKKDNNNNIDRFATNLWVGIAFPWPQ